MEELERKTIQFAAERSLEEWGVLLKHLGEYGVIEIVEVPTPNATDSAIPVYDQEIDEQLSLDLETQMPPSKPLSKSDIFDITKDLGFTDKLAGRAWGILTRLFTLKDNPELFSDKSWFDKDGYDFVPLVFNDIPKKDIYGRYDSDKLSGLRPESLQELLDLYDTNIDNAPNNKARIEVRNKILGINAGRSTINLLRMIALKTVQTADPIEDTSSL